MANNGVYYSSGHSLNFTTSSTTWATLTSGGTFLMNAVSATTYYNLPVSGLTGGSNISVTGSNGNYTISYTGTSGTSGDYLPLSGGTVTGATVFQSGLTANTFYTNYIDFNTSSTPVNNEGRLIWNNADEIGGLEVTMMSGNTILQIGEENLARVYNADSVTLTAGTVVYVFGSQGNTISVKRASNSGETTSSRALGVVSESIAVGARGFVNTFGLVKGLNTLAYSGGTPIWLGTTPGSWTSTEPDAPNHTVLIGFISRSANSPNGSLFVHINNGWELNELHNVYAPSPSNGDILKYSAATSVWINSNTLNLNSISATTISATTYENLPVSALTSSTYITATPSNGNYTIALTGPLLSYYVSGSTPGGTQVSGDRWLDTNTGDELVWVDDGNSQQWVQVSSGSAGGSGGGSTSVITVASSVSEIASNGNIYVGHQRGGWAYFYWDITAGVFTYNNVNCGINIPQNIPDGKTINVDVIAYSVGGNLEALKLYLFKLSNTNLGTISNIYTSGYQYFDVNGNLCFNYSYTLGIGEGFIKSTDYLVIGFEGNNTNQAILVSFTITAS